MAVNLLSMSIAPLLIWHIIKTVLDFSKYHKCCTCNVVKLHCKNTRTHTHNTQNTIVHHCIYSSGVLISQWYLPNAGISGMSQINIGQFMSHWSSFISSLLPAKHTVNIVLLLSCNFITFSLSINFTFPYPNMFWKVWKKTYPPHFINNYIRVFFTDI